MIRHFYSLAIVILFASSCAVKYVTPGSDVKISTLADEDISRLLSNKPSSEFPANIAIARVQHPEYTSHSYRREHRTKFQGQSFSLILTRDAGEDSAFKKLNE